jgi:H+/Cl- antiporter ClcA
MSLEAGGTRLPHGADSRIDARLGVLSAFALVIGVLSAAGAMLLLAAIRLFINLFFFHTWSLAARSPAAHHFGPWVIGVPALGGLIIGLMARYGTEKIRGHGIPEAIKAIRYGKSRMSVRVAILKPLSPGIAIGSGGPFGAEGPIIMTRDPNGVRWFAPSGGLKFRILPLREDRACMEIRGVCATPVVSCLEASAV